MVISKSLNTLPCNVTVNGDKLEQVDQFSYLGSLITQDSRCDKEIKRRIGISKKVFHSMEKVLTSRSINMCTKMRLLKCYLWSTLLYECESWIISKTMESQLEAAEMWLLRRMLRIAWTDKVSKIKFFKEPTRQGIS